jgi:signal transduction histidine kinase
MPEEILYQGAIPFHAEGRLLQELGLRLVASPEVALVELIKNAYDADSTTCTVRLEEENKTLVVDDDGHGMTRTDFMEKWMRIATTSKLSQEFSPKYHRRLTGAKGIGRFAVRYLGDHLSLESVAFDNKHNCVARLTAVFDWPKLDETGDISEIKVAYKLVRMPDDTPNGTKLTITKLRSTGDFANSRELRNNVLRMVSPIQGLERGRFASLGKDGNIDPGFNVHLPGKAKEEDLNLAKLVLDNYWARLTIDLEGEILKFRVKFSSLEKSKFLKTTVTSNISKGFFADIRFFPRRKGVFHAKGINGKQAWTWVRSNCGVAVVDHSFRMQPYGFSDDDWLQLDIHKARNIRNWTTSIAKDFFPVAPGVKEDPGANPVLNLPYNFQLVGAVFIESKRKSKAEEETDLVPAMDREGLLTNVGFKQLREFVRAGIEYIAHEDKAELDRLAEIASKEIVKTSIKEIHKAIEVIQGSPTLNSSDKARIIKHYRHLAERIEEEEKYSDRTKQNLVTMSLLGVVAGFMMHESKAIVHDMSQAVLELRALSKKSPELAIIADELERRLENFEGYLSYARMFVKNVGSPKVEQLPAAGQIRHVLNKFKVFADNRGIKVSYEASDDVMTPPLPVTVYSGVLLNLYTNALKAVIAAQASIKEPHILIKAWNENGDHFLEVMDNGIGIPQEVRKRIWDPLYTTTSDVGNPLGSGMGLGLPLIKQVVSDFNGKVMLLSNPPSGFTTCFKITFPKK